MIPTPQMMKAATMPECQWWLISSVRESDRAREWREFNLITWFDYVVRQASSAAQSLVDFREQKIMHTLLGGKK